MEELYMKHSRNDTNYVFLKLIMDSLISPILSPERIVMEHAMLISLLHANVGIEIGKNFSLFYYVVCAKFFELPNE